MYPIEFGYNPPTGQRGLEDVRAETFVRDLQHVLDVASPYFSSFWVSDHIMIGSNYRLDCWTQLTWIAARYPRQLIGTNVMANSFRHPPLLAKMAASLQALSGGRLILGYGAGWVEDEYRAYGYDFPAPRIRIAQMVDGIRVMRALWTEAPASYAGEYYAVNDAYCEPRPDPVPPILIGGDGERYLLAAVAEYADIWLVFARQPDIVRHKTDVLHRHCERVGRDPSTIRVSMTLPVYLATTREAAERRAGPKLGDAQPPFAGTSSDLCEQLQHYIDLGVSLFQMVFPGFPQTDDLQLFAEEVLPNFQHKNR